MSEKKDEKEEKISLSTNTLYALFLGAMFVLAAFQTVQLSELKQEVALQGNTIVQLGGSASLSPAPQQTSQAGTGQASIPESLQNVPDMVGGC